MIKHNEMVKALAKSGEKIAAEINAEDAHLLHMAVGISSEAGELLDAIKKQVIYRKVLDRENVIEELGDLEFYMEGIRQGLGMTREQCLDANIVKLGKRYEGLQYTDAAAQDRADKVDPGGKTASMLAPHQLRVAQEREALDENITKLNAFIGGERYVALDPGEQDRLSRQRLHMIQYLDVLDECISAF